MIGFVVKILTGSAAGPWILIGAVIALLGVGSAGGYVARGVIDAPKISDLKTDIAKLHTDVSDANGRTTQCKLDHETGRANSAEGAVTALTNAAGLVTDAMTEVAAAAARRAKQDSQFQKELNNAPTTSLCSGSAAERAFRNAVSGGVRGSAAAPTTAATP